MDTQQRKYLSDTIGQAAMLEQTAEEAAEFAKACLKMARYLRNENPVSAKYTEQKMHEDLVEETADIKICIDELEHLGLLDNLNKQKETKIQKDRYRVFGNNQDSLSQVTSKHKDFTDTHGQARGIVYPSGGRQYAGGGIRH